MKPKPDFELSVLWLPDKCPNLCVSVNNGQDKY